MSQKTIWKIHGWTGLYLAIMIAFLSITGSAALFRYELDALSNPRIYFIDKKPAKGNLDAALQKVLDKHPDKYLFEVELVNNENGAWNFRLFPDERNELFPLILEVFVDRYTEEIIAERNYYKTFSYFLRNLHVRFYEQFYGRQIVGLAGIALFVSCVTGIMIYGRFMKKAVFGVVRQKNIRIKMADLHKYVGIASLLFNLIIALTGAWLGLQPLIMKTANMNTPNAYTVDKKMDAKEDQRIPVRLDSILQLSSRRFDHFTPQIIRPSADGQAIVHVYGDVLGQVYERRSNRITYDKFSYQMLDKYNITDQSNGAKLYYIQEALHFGDFGGLAMKILYFVFGMTSSFMALSGFVVYHERRKGVNAKSSLIKQILFWLLAIIVFCMLIGLLSMTLAIGIPSMIVSSVFYLSVLFLFGRILINRMKKRSM